MNTTTLRRAFVPGVAAFALAASLTACGSNNDDSAGDGSSSGGASTGSSSSAGGGAASGLSGKITAGGSSAQETAQEAWRAGFGQANPDVTISYNAVGSGDGRANFISGAYSFAGSDSAMSDDELKQAKAKCGGDVIEVPAYISPIDVFYNLPSVKQPLNLDPSTVAKIFSGKITTWNDPAIAALNKGVSLPSTKITPVHRSDSSGTTDNFTDWLNKAAPKDWTSEHSSDWPTSIKGGESAEKTTGVTDTVTGTEGMIGYADDSGVKDLKGVGIAKIKVGSQFVAPSADGAAAGLAASKLNAGAPTVLSYSINRTSTDPKTYPLFLASYLIACPKYDDQSTADIVKAFLTYAVSSDGQQAAAANAYSAPLPADISAKDTQAISTIS